MELKKYQKKVLADLQAYLECLNESGSLEEAFASYWHSQQVPVGGEGVTPYQNTFEGVPHVCFKVPTGGGKTFLATASVKPVFEALPALKTRTVVWLVPSDVILSQTIQALKDPTHPYRQRLNADFAGRVEVYSKEELLAGQNFSAGSAVEQLSVMVLSYDSFRANRKEGRKAFQPNENLAGFLSYLPEDDSVPNGNDGTALMRVIGLMNPLVIVDESHHATSRLSQEMLRNFNPAFILELTATPKPQSNIISYVDALALKSENMVKLPVIAYNRSSQTEVITDAIDLRASLEAVAAEQETSGGPYIRPIVLFQAQPRTNEDAMSFQRMREKLKAAGIPEGQIAIKTAEIDELKDVDLLSRDCDIRFIITVNALKEGWDCPFAYILASLANKTSAVDVEQILGRVLRQPHATRQRNPLLNMSYVLTSSNDFSATLSQIVAGLNQAGFSKRDFRVATDAASRVTPSTGENQTDQNSTVLKPQSESSQSDLDEEFLEFNESEVESALKEREASGIGGNCETTDSDTGIGKMLDLAEERGEEYEEEARNASKLGDDFVPSDLEDVVDTVAMIPDLVEDAASVKIPQFFIQAPSSVLFPTDDDGVDLLRHEVLADNFTLSDKDTQLNLAIADEEMFRVDVNSKADVPRAFRMSSNEQRLMRDYFGQLSVESQKRSAADAIYEKLKSFNFVRDEELRTYIVRITENFNSEDLRTYQEHPHAVANKIRDKIRKLLQTHKARSFYEAVETRRIVVKPSYSLPAVIQPIQSTSLIGGSLYEAEDRMNSDEMEFAGRLSAMENVKWWHRIIDRKGFCLNGPFNHYPDFLVRTEKGTLVVVETKGEQLKNEDSRLKLKLGQRWAAMAGDKFRYYMVFRDHVDPLEGALTESEVISVIEQL